MSEQPTSALPDFGSFGTTQTSTQKTRPNDTRDTRRALAWNGGTDLGLLLLRFAVGGLFFAHGMQKVFGMWGYPGIGEFTASVTAAGYQSAATLAWVVGVVEIVGGAFLVAVGYGMVAPILPVFVRSFDVGITAASLVISVFALSRLVFAPMSGRIVARFGELPGFVTGVAIVAAIWS